jgi:hypothetical protein
MENRLGLFLLIVVCGIFTAGVLVLLSEPPEPNTTRTAGALLLASGLVSIAFARRIAAAQRELEKKMHLPEFLAKTRPITIIVMGGGVALLGILQFLGF